jgi:hypothetical protein
LTRSRALRAIKNDPALPALVQSLSPPALAQLCSRIGVSDATDIMAAATTGQLVRALDVLLWKSPRPGLPEVFDHSELMECLAAWLEVGEGFTADALDRIPDEDILLYLSHVLTVSTQQMWGFERSTEIEDLERIYAPSYHESAYGPYFVTAIAAEHWEILRASLDAWWLRDPERLLHLFSQLAAGESMLEPQESRASSNADVAFGRETERERLGHVTASGARAFLVFADGRSLDELAALQELDPETRRHLSAIGNPSELRSEVELLLTHADPAADSEALGHEVPADGAAVEAIRAELAAEGLLDAPPRQLLLTHSASGTSLPLIEALVELSGSNAGALDARARELAYLGNVLLAGVALNDTAMSTQDARQAALSLCNLGFELLLQRRQDPGLPDGEPGLVRLFLVGRAALRDIPDRVVQAFAGALTRLAAASSAPGHEWRVSEAQAAFDDLRAAVACRDLAAARDALNLMSFFFDSPSCQGAAALLDEIPRLARRAGGTTVLTWIGTLGDLADVSRWLDTIEIPIKGHRRV